MFHDENRKLIYEGKAKILYTTSNHDGFIQHFKDDITAFNNQKHDIIDGKGIINNYISGFLMKSLSDIEIPTHLIKILNMREQLVQKLEMIALEVVVRNVVSGSLLKRINMTEGKKIKEPIIEFYYKNDKLNDPLVTDEHIMSAELLQFWEIDLIKEYALKINDFLRGIFYMAKITLVDFKLEFGYLDGNIVLGDEISPDSCRLWDIETKEKMDKDRYRLSLGNVIDGYRKVANRLGLINIENQ
ncbi:MAG: phosphoribosylaminoimidazolesuccinocarboxamide synthase [Anaplasmataceae bacterium]|nr:phosphoribosylaminoimidazolesuccinocarboxamide synthase [Anaplasmataceae bacterium]